MTNTVGLAQHDLDESTAALSAVERQAGRDLAELRTLNESPSSDSALRRMANELEAELRTYRALVGSNLELLALLESAKDEPGRLLASPSRLLEAQPALRRLKDGLVDAQLRTATVLGTMSPEHPAAQAAQAGEQEIGTHLREEIGIAIKGLQIDLRLAQERVAALERNREDLQNRLAQLANIRAEYANLVAANRHRSDLLKTVQQELSEAQAGQAAARKSSLITLIDRPDAGSKPAGPGKTTIVMGGFLAGVIFGLGILFLTIQPHAEAVTEETRPAHPAASSAPREIAPHNALPMAPVVTAPVVTAPVDPVPVVAAPPVTASPVTTSPVAVPLEAVPVSTRQFGETLRAVPALAEVSAFAATPEPTLSQIIAPAFAAVEVPLVGPVHSAAAEPVKAVRPVAEPIKPAPRATNARSASQGQSIPAGSMSLKRALQKLDGDAGVWN